jgi:hypothetical protein
MDVMEGKKTVARNQLGFILVAMAASAEDTGTPKKNNSCSKPVSISNRVRCQNNHRDAHSKFLPKGPDIRNQYGMVLMRSCI